MFVSGDTKKGKSQRKHKEQNANLVAPKSLFMQFPGNESQNDHKLFLSWYAHLFAMRLYCFFHQNLFPLMCTGFVTSFFSMECGRNHIMQLPKLDHKGACMFGFCSLEMLPWDHYSWRTLGCTEGHQASKDREVQLSLGSQWNQAPSWGAN